MDEHKIECYNAIDKYFSKYKDSDYMLQRVYNHIVGQLPNTLKNEYINHEKRINLNSYLKEEQQIFIQVFLSKNNYYHLPNIGLFYKYDGKNYYIIKEDEIIHTLLSSISKDRILLKWKHKTKITIIKQIKERNLFSSIPETETIQSVLNVTYPAIFQSKSAAKYFLTVIGDILLGKNSQSNLIFLITPKMKELLNELNKVVMSSVGNFNLLTHIFITKHHENHIFENYRLIKINEQFSNNYWREMLKQLGLNLICVASHYSNRYENSDKFLAIKSDEELINYTYTLKNTTQSDIVDKFINECIDNTTTEYKIEWKNIYFIWKQFLSNTGMPNVVFVSALKYLLVDKLSYNKETDSFIGVTSKYLPYYKDFISFWDSTMIATTGNDFVDEIEIDEINSLFKQWSKNKNTISEEYIIQIIKYFFNDINILEDKFIINIKSTLWDKINDINNSFEYIKKCIQEDYKLSLISFDGIYNFYQTYCTKNNVKFIVSKRYFEKYLCYKFADYIVYDKFVKIEWITT